jgi:hypothetical protein
MSIEHALVEFLRDAPENREHRLTRNMRDFSLCRSDAEILDESMVECVKACVATLGKRIDCMGQTNGLRAAAIKLFPVVVTRNFIEILEFLSHIELVMLFENRAIKTPNPEHPDCDCGSCCAVREISEQLVRQPTVN